MENEPILLTVKEAMAALKIKRNLIYDLISSGDLVSIKLRSRRLIPRLELEAYVQRLVQEAGRQK